MAAFAFLSATFFPPWLYTHDQNGSNGGHTHTPAGYYCLFSPPRPTSESVTDGVSLDMSRLMLEWVCILAVTGAAWFFLNVESVTGSAAQSSASVSTGAENRKSFSRAAKWIAAGTVAVCLVCAVIAKMVEARQERERLEQLEKQNQEAFKNYQLFIAKWITLKPGMSQQQVVNILGKPDEVFSDLRDTLGQWQYRRNTGNGTFLGNVSFSPQGALIYSTPVSWSP